MKSPCVEVLFVQGASAGAHDADQVLADALAAALGVGLRLHFPRMPDEEAPDNDVWKQWISTELDRGTAIFLVAHSAGAAIVADMLAQGLADRATAMRGAFLLAPPFVGRGGWQLDGFHLDRPVATGPLPMHLYFGLADQTVPPAHAELYATVFPDATIHRLAGCDHQFGGFMARVAKDVLAVTGRGVRVV